MGKQIHLFHLKEDMKEISLLIEQHGYIVCSQSSRQVVENMSDIWLDWHTYYIGNYETIFNKIDFSIFPHPLISYTVPQIAYSQSMPKDQTWINNGRIYANKVVYSDEKLIDFFNILAKHIKKNYIHYCGYYMSHRFWDEFKNGNIIPCNVNRPISELK